MSKQLVLSPERCVNCRTCELMCSFEHHGLFNPRLSNVTVFDYEEQAISVPIMCLQCEEACCLKACPTGALTRNEKGTVVLNVRKCIVCKMCVSACPLGNISFSPITKKIFKCDLCGDKDPMCAKYCPTGAIMAVDPLIASDRKRNVADKMVTALEEVPS